jgi:acetyltransferase
MKESELKFLSGKPTGGGIEDAQSNLRRRNQALSVFFSPRSVAVVGASEAPGSAGRTVLWNLISNPFGGTVYPVNPKRANCLGIKAYPSITALPEPVDLAVIVTPARAVPEILDECAATGVKGAIIISAGFRETGPDGERLEKEILAAARRGPVRVIGPNCLGVMSPITGLNATFAGTMARPGNVGFISQSGALCTAILDWSLREMVGFSSFISVGSMVDIGWGDMIDYLGDDPRTRSIVIYMESIGDARSFLSAAREVALTKPIIVIKAGRTDAAAKAAASHTGALTGSDEILDAAFRRSGVLRVQNISDLFYMAEVLARQPRPRGPRLSILTNAGGPGVLATDALITAGGELAELSAETMEKLNDLLPQHWSHNNPVDILSDASPDRYARAVEILAKDPGSDGLLVILTPQAMTDPTRTAEQLRPFSKIEGKPILASWMGGADVTAGESILNRANIPTFPYPDTATRAFAYMWRYSYVLRGLYETPMPAVESEETVSSRARAEEIVQKARGEGRTLLNEVESKLLLSAYGIPTVETRVALTENEAVEAAASIGYPAVLKLLSGSITHKSDVGGVRLNLCNSSAVREAYRDIKAAVGRRAGEGHFLGVTVQPMVQHDGYELIVGTMTDSQLGPVILFGSGGRMVEVYRDRALGLPPLNTTLARRMMEQTRVFAALCGTSGRDPVDIGALEHLLVSFSRLVEEQRWIRELDINPLLASAKGLLALDARIVLYDSSVKTSEIPRPAIRPYPSHYASHWTMKDGTPVLIRPIRPEDEPMMARFHETLSERSVYFRYFHPMRLNVRVSHERLTRMCFIDYSREIALVVEFTDPVSGEQSILAVGRLVRVHGSNDGEFAIVVSDNWHRRGLGTELLQRLIEIGRKEKLSRIVADILPDNQDMLRLCETLGFARKYWTEAGVVKAELGLE